MHLLSQHGCCGLLLDQVVPPVNLQLGFQVWRWVQVFAVLTCTAPLRKGGRKDDTERRQTG